MNQDIDVGSYFMERAPESGKNTDVWNRVADTLLQNGVNTMEEFCEKSDEWIFRLFVSKKDGRMVLDEEARDLSRDIRREYQTTAAKAANTVRKAELLAAGEIFAGPYIHENAPADFPQAITNRVINALKRGGIETMRELSALSIEELSRIRSIGGKSLALVLLMRKKYMSEQ